MFETGHFATLWRDLALRLGLEVDFVAGDWRHGVDPAVVEEKLAGDRGGKIKAVAVVHNETSTGVASRLDQVRKAIDRAGHPALFIVDTISSLGSMDYRHDEWRVDVSVGCSQKGLMLPPGLGLNAVSHKGDLNDLMLAGTLCGVEMGLALAGVPFTKGGVAAALDFLAGR
jgi:alanine-glyoxylate transaminase/serine-glyoxylate transaminase/serine-pyruvate transaminase